MVEMETGEAYRPQDERLIALQRLLNSRTLSNSEAIRRILKYIVEVSVSGHAQEIKEYTIATEALKFADDFDPKANNKIRVQMQRLRKKLEEYYSREGAQDPLRVVIPVGHYTPHFERSPSPENAGPATDPAPHSDAAPVTFRNRVVSSAYGIKGFILILAISILALAVSLFRRPVAHELQRSQVIAMPAPFACLWSPFVADSKPPLIIYSNALFLMSRQGDLYRYFDAAAHPLPLGAEVLSLAGLERNGPMPRGIGPLYYFDAYTGTGEVVAAARIGQLLSQEDRSFNIERDGVVSYEDIRGSNVIFLGASLEDSVLRTLPVKADLVFEDARQPQFVGSLEIRDFHPAPGQPAVYKLERDPKTGAIEGEYALVALLPGVAPAHYIMLLGGISTVGTEAAAEFATSKDCMAIIAGALANAPDKAGIPRYFEALLHVQIRNGEGAKTTCLFVRTLSPQPEVALNGREEAPANPPGATPHP